jgi:uncharacterized membrane protein (TIGR01666 family)
MPNTIEKTPKLLKQFLFSQYFSDGFRITLGVLLPSLICYHYGFTQQGIAISLGALCVSIPDNPGPIDHRRNAMLITLVLSIIMAILTGIFAHYPWILAGFIFTSCFVFSMLNVFGTRAASVGVSVLIILILGIDTKLPFIDTLKYAGLISAGGTWYFLLSIGNQSLRPYRPAEQTLGECVMDVATFIRIKAQFYDPGVDLNKNYGDLLDQQVVVNQHQENVRDILFRTRKLLMDSSPTGRRLLLTFVDLIDLYEQTNATYYKYNELHEQYGKTDILPYFHQIIVQLAEELEHIGEGLHNHESTTAIHDFRPRLALIKSKIDALGDSSINTLMLKRILVNLKNIATRIHRIYDYERAQTSLPESRSKELPRFVSRQFIDWNLFRENLTFSSSHFRHAARVSIVCMLAYVFTLTVSEGPHSYWILLTIIVILKPGFSLTKQRNIERVIGTVAGGLIGIAVLFFFEADTTRFAFLVLFMLLSYSFIRLKYVVSVLFMTPYILIVFSFTTNYNDAVVTWERIIDTLIGAGAAFAASYFVFPSWESYQLKTSIVDMLAANVHYLQKVIERDSQHEESQSGYRLARKDLYVNTAHLTTAFQRMLSEPKSKQKQADTVYRFGVLNHQLSSYLATLSYQMTEQETLSSGQFKELRSTWFVLKDCYEKIAGKPLSQEIFVQKTGIENEWISPDFLADFHQTALDMRKIVSEFNFEPE